MQAAQGGLGLVGVASLGWALQVVLGAWEWAAMSGQVAQGSSSDWALKVGWVALGWDWALKDLAEAARSLGWGCLVKGVAEGVAVPG